MTSIAIIADYNSTAETHVATANALEHAAAEQHLSIRTTWIPTKEALPLALRDCSGVIIGTGVYENRSNVFHVIQHARENNIPTLATCGGFQHMVIEYARNVLGVSDAEHAEHDPTAANAVIVPLACSLRGREMTIFLKPDSQVCSLYQTAQARERYFCNFGVRSDFIDTIAASPLRIVGSDSEGVLRVTELPAHPFFVGTLFVPQIKSAYGSPHPLISGFLRAAAVQ